MSLACGSDLISDTEHGLLAVRLFGRMEHMTFPNTAWVKLHEDDGSDDLDSWRALWAAHAPWMSPAECQAAALRSYQEQMFAEEQIERDERRGGGR